MKMFIHMWLCVYVFRTQNSNLLEPEDLYHGFGFLSSNSPCLGTYQNSPFLYATEELAEVSHI